jgi:hypothetical protein
MGAEPSSSVLKHMVLSFMSLLETVAETDTGLKRRPTEPTVNE